MNIRLVFFISIASSATTALIAAVTLPMQRTPSVAKKSFYYLFVACSALAFLSLVYGIFVSDQLTFLIYLGSIGPLLALCCFGLYSPIAPFTRSQSLIPTILILIQAPFAILLCSYLTEPPVVQDELSFDSCPPGPCGERYDHFLGRSLMDLVESRRK